MLDRAKLLKELSSVTEELFTQDFQSAEFAAELWRQYARVRQIDTYSTIEPLSDYAILAVDGSQIYPDRHQSARCFLINIGSIYIRYGTQSAIELGTEPFVCTLKEDAGLDGAVEIVNGLREERELQAGFAQGMLRRGQDEGQLLVLFDGSIIFWHLDAKDEATRERFLSSYLSTLSKFERAQLPMASYISFPKSKELVQLLRSDNSDARLELLVDAHIMAHVLDVGQRTVVFENKSPIAEFYPSSLKPHFFYINTGQEIGRVELPAWLAHDEKAVAQIAAIILDQANKGRGYPIVLAEAHEQAVVKGPDRDFFYHVVQKLGIEHRQRYTISRKSLNKRSIGI